MKIAALIALSILLPFHSCSTHRDMGANQSKEGHFRLYSFPEKPREYFFDDKNPDRKEIIFAAINDFQGQIQPKEEKLHDPSQNQTLTIKTGGIAGMHAYLDILKQKFPGQVSLISSGSMFASDKEIDETLFYLNTLGLEAAGLSKSDFSLSFKKDYMRELDEKLTGADFKIISSNLFNLQAGEEFNFENILKSAISETNGINIGYLSLVSPSMAQALDQNKMNKVYFQPMAAKIITLANDLRKKGADIVALMISNGLDCTSQIAQAHGIDEKKVNFRPENDKVCDLYENDLVETLKKLPPNLIDIVFTNGIDSKVSNIVQGYPILQNFEGGNYLAWAKLVFDTKHRRVVKSKTQIMQPIQICHKFFEETEDCFSKETLRNVEMVPAKFLGEEISIGKLPIRK